MGSVNRKSAIRTAEGGRARSITPEEQLRRSVLTCLLWEDNFYEDGEAIADRIQRLVGEVTPEVAGEVAIEARENQKLRHVPLLVARAMAKHGYQNAADTIQKVIQRPDELTEFLALYWLKGREPLSKQVKKGLARAFTKFNEYQLAKYNRDGKDQVAGCPLHGACSAQRRSASSRLEASCGWRT